jgi:LysR family hydrogen peroxide-inducible transcriptional activator
MRALPTPRQLEALVAVADTLHFHDAARRLGVSQSALSVQIRGLEQLLRVRLFDRDRHAVRLTEAGRAVVARARTLLTELDGLHDEALRFLAPFTGPLRLGLIPTVAPYVVPRLVAVTRELHPNLRLVVAEDRTRALVERLQAGTIDLLVLDLDVQRGASECAPLLEERFLAAVHVDHALARRSVVTEADLMGLPVLLLEDGHCLRERALSLCRFVGAREDSDLRASALHTLVQMVEAGEGVTLLPEIAVEVECRGAAHVVVRPLTPLEPAGRRLGLVWRANSERGDEYRALAVEWRGRLEAWLAPARARTGAPTTGVLRPERPERSEPRGGAGAHAAT